MNKHKIFFYVVADILALALLITITQQSAAQTPLNSQPQEAAVFYTIQVCSLLQKDNAEKLSNRLSRKGYAAFIRKGQKDNTAIYRVCAGHYSTRPDAQKEATAFSRKEKFSCIVTTVRDSLLVTMDTSAKSEHSAAFLQRAEDKQKKNDATAISLHDSVAANNTKKHLETIQSSLYQGLPFKLYLEAEPSLRWQLYYEDNIYGGEKDIQSDFSNRYTPEFMINIKSDKFALSGEMQLLITEYMHEREWNTVNQDYTLTATYNFNPRVIVALTGVYSVNTDANRYFKTDTDDIGSVALEGSYYVNKYKTKTRAGGLTYKYLLSPRSSVDMLVNYSNFDTGGSENSDFYIGGLGYNYNLTTKTTLNLNYDFNYLHFAYSGGDTQFIQDLISGGDYTVNFGSDFKSKIHSLSGGLSHEFSNDSQIAVSLRWSHNVQEIKTETTDNATGEKISEKRKPSGDSIDWKITYEKAFTDTRIKFDIDQGTGTNANSDTSFTSRYLTTRVSHYFTRRFSGSLSFRYNIYHADGGDIGYKINRHILYVSSSFSYVWTRWLNVSVGYTYSKNHNKTTHSTTERNTCYVSLNIHPLRPYVFR